MTKEQLAILALQAGFEALLGLFRRHQQGENVTADLDALLKKVQSLKAEEEFIANEDLGTGSVGSDPNPLINPDNKPKTTDELIKGLKVED